MNIKIKACLGWILFAAALGVINACMALVFWPLVDSYRQAFAYAMAFTGLVLGWRAIKALLDILEDD